MELCDLSEARPIACSVCRAFQAPNVTLLARRKPKPHPWPHGNTTFTAQTDINGVASICRMNPAIHGTWDTLARVSVKRATVTSDNSHSSKIG